MNEYENHNPDVLSCLASLSNDEVFTPPNIANQMLDLLPKEIWSDPQITFLDPCCKSGIFLREIAKRLIVGLKDVYPDLQERINHICKEQLFGVAITELTALLSRRSLYCSKNAAGEYSICTGDFVEEGHILFEPMRHSWSDSKCIFCGASSDNFDRSSDLESHAYQFIHVIDPLELFHMKFDVIVGNPPYQLNTAGDDNGPQAKPLYHKFVEQAIKLKPSYLVMITPSRWFSGGWGVDDFRDMMINSNHIREIHDYIDSSDCFTGVDIKGGVSYFLYDKNYSGPCKFVSYESDGLVTTNVRYLKEKDCDVLIRYNELISIYRKVQSKGISSSVSSIVSGRSPFGLNTNHYGHADKKNESDVPYFERKGWTYIERSMITRNEEAIEKYKFYIAKTAEDGMLPGKVIGNITYGPPGTICSGTYLMVGPFNSEKQMKNAASYFRTKFFRALVAINKISQDAYSKVYSSVPNLNYDESWNDQKLFDLYDLSNEEIAFIEKMILPMGGDSDE